MRWTSISVAAFALVGCGSNPLVSDNMRNGTFCDQLRYVLVLGSEKFETPALAGHLVNVLGQDDRHDRYYRGGLLLKDAEACYLYRYQGDARLPSKYFCYFGDETTQSADSLRRKLSQLDDQVSECLVRTDWPTFTDQFGRHKRYFRSAQSDPEDIKYIDHYIFHQTVDVFIKSRGTEGLSHDLPDLQSTTLVLLIYASRHDPI